MVASTIVASYGQPSAAQSVRHDPRPNRVAFDFRDGWSESVLQPYETMRATMGKTLGYARISTNEGQDVASQKVMLEKLGAVVVFVDIGNGSSLTGRDQLEAALRLLDEGDTLLALHPDRLARDTADLLTIAKRVIEKKAVLRINDPAIVLDGSDIMAEVMLTVFGLVGMLEKHFIRARQRRGIDAAKARGGVYKGRPATISPDAVRDLRQQGLGATQIAKRLGIGRASVYRALAA
jgi:DNA invertase Pin-like site-specific DNA recombinase